MRIKIILLFILLATTKFLFGQTQEQIKQITAGYDADMLQSLSEQFNKQYRQDKAFAQKMATILNLPLAIEEDGKYKELQKVLPNGTPLYYATFNLDAARSTRTNHLQIGGSLGLNLMGLNMTAHIWDAGIARITHQEYDGAGGTNRYSVGDGTTTRNFHSAHVAGTIMASGVVAQSKGMAPYGKAIGYNWNNDLSEATNAANTKGMLISSHSYGWDASEFGPGDMWLFGAYAGDSRDWDNLMFNAPYYLMVVAAGNDGQAPYNTQPLNGMNGYDKLTGHATSKNTLVIANAQDANIDSGGNLIGVQINLSSSQGPTDDYRIKPDLTGNGTGVYSTYENADNAYASISGTSMATPNVSGTCLLLQELYNRENSVFMKAATLKGLVLHTADDAGPVGPDVVWGWGLMNSKKAAETIMLKDSHSIMNELTISNGQTLSFNVDSDGMNPLVASISWTDRPGTANNGNLNQTTPVLVNDLDIRITKGGTTFYPWKLTGVTTNTKADNSVDPFERVDVSGASGTYTITISHKGTLTGGSQNFSLIVTGINTTPCPMSITSATADPVCNSGTSNIVVSGSAGTAELRLYTLALGGTPIATINGASGTFTTPVISQTTTFYLSAYNGSCESVRLPITVDVSPSPPAVSITNTVYPSGGDDCNFDYSELTANGGKISNISVYSDNLSTSSWGLQSTNTGRIAAAFYNSANAGGTAPEIAIYRVGSANSPNSECMVFPLVDGSDLALDITGYTELNFQFKHNFRYRARANSSRNVYVAVSTDGTNYTIVWTRTNISGNINAETINVDLNPYLGGTVLYFMFGYYGDSAAFDYWYFDDIQITAAKQATITWSPTTGLFTDQALSLPYTAGTNAKTVYAVPSGTQNYTASARFSPASCAATDMTQVVNNTASFIAGNGNWDVGSNWQTQTIPDITKCVKVPNGKTLTVNVENAEAKNISVSPGGKVIIQKDKALRLDDFIKNDAGVDGFVIESGGSLVQNNDNAVNTGEIKAKRNFKFSTERKQYNFIISPVIGQKIKFIYNNPPFVIYHKEETDFFYNAYDGDYIAGRGLAIKEPTVASVPASTTDAVMKGEPFNGVLNYPLKYTTADPAVDHGVNLVGNPYPSHLDLKQLYADNSSKIGSTFDFWDNIGNELFEQQGSEYDGSNFARYNAVSDTGSAAPTNANNPDKKIPNKYARPATAFYVFAQPSANGLTLDFKNQYRSATANSAPEFFGKNIANPPPPDRFWLTMTTQNGLDFMTALTYFEGGTPAYALDDSDAYGASDNIYSLVDERQLAIQGKSLFVASDVVPLGVKLNNMGTNMISVYKSEGVFAENQHIYIHDKTLGLVHDLTLKPYKFVSRKGEFNHRFEIIYHPSDPGLSFENQNRITIEKINHNIVITSSIDPISEIEIFDIHSRSVYKKTGISSNEHKVAANLFNHQIIVVTVKTETGEIMTKKFVNK